MPEALVAALDELDRRLAGGDGRPGVHRRVRRDPARVRRRAQPALRRRRGSPSMVGARILLKREDLNHTGAHKIRNVLGQALLTKRMGKTRVIAETGAGQHGVASATAAAYFGLDCTVYMGEVDTKRQALNVARMQLLGAKVVPVDSGSAHPQGRHQRGAARLGRQRRPHGLPLRHRRRPAPVPEHGPRLHPRHRRRGPRPVPRAAPARCPTPIAACVGGGSNAIGLFTAFLDDARRRDLRLRGRRRGRRDRPARRHDPRRRQRRAARRPHLRAAGRGRPDHRVALDLGRASTTPASARSTPTSPRPAGPTYLPGHRRRGDGRARAAGPHRGHHPARSSPRTRVAGALRRGRASSARTALVAGQPLRPRRQGHGDRASTGSASATDGTRASDR